MYEIAESPLSAEATQLAGAFLASLSNPNTRNTYRFVIKNWYTYCIQYSLEPIRGVRSTHIDIWMRQLEAKGKASATVGLHVSTVMAFYSWLVHEGFAEQNPAARVRKPRQVRRQDMPYLTRTELSDWLGAAEEIGGYAYALACLLGINGLRVSEATGARIEDLGEANYHKTLLIMGKGSRPDIIPLPPRVMMAVAQAVGARRIGYILLSSWDTRMSRNAAARVVERITRKARIEKRLTPHSLRHSAITAALNAGVALRDVQLFARHTEPKTTMHYDRSRNSLERHASYTVMQYVSGAI
jgi:integrase/recombinase XerD